MLPQVCAPIKPLGHARPRFGHQMHELTAISGPGDRADPDSGVIGTCMDRPAEPLSFRFYRGHRHVETGGARKR